MTVAVPSWRNDIAAADRAGPAPGLRPTARRSRRGRLRGDRAGGRPDRGSAAPARPGRRAAGLAAARRPGAAADADAAPERAPRSPAARWPRAAWRNASPSASWPRREAALFGDTPDDAAADATRSPPIWTSCARRRWRRWRWRRSATPRAAMPMWRCSRSGRPSRRRAGRADAGRRRPARRRTRRATGSRRRAPVDAMDAKADLLGRCWPRSACRWRRCSVTADAPGFYHPGRSGMVRQGPKTVLAHVRRTASARAGGAGPGRPGGGVRAVPGRGRRPEAPPQGARPTCRRSSRCGAISPSWCDSDVPAEAVLRAARGAERTLIAGVTLFDVYEGDRLPTGQKSLGSR